MAGWPLIGRFVRIGVAVIRLPELRSRVFEAERKQAEIEAQLVPSVVEKVLEINHRLFVLETRQLPDYVGKILEINHRLFQVETQQLPSINNFALEINHRQAMFETQQLPTLLQTVSDLNHHRLVSENLVKSMPGAMRNITRDVVALQGQSTALEARLDEMRDRIGGQLKLAENHLTEIEAKLGSASTSLEEKHNRLNSLTDSVGYLLGRVEFVRRELMFEMRYGASEAPTQGGPLRAEVKIEDSEKLAAAKKSGLRINLGCGHVPLPGFVNVDRRELPGVDVVAEVDDLPFEQGEVQEIFSAHLLEHFPQEQLKRTLLGYWHGLLKPGGEFRAVVPDADGMIKAYASQEYPFERFREVTYGGQDYDGDFHFNMFTTGSLSQMLTDAGFVDINVIADNRENGGCKEFEISARRGSNGKRG